MKEKEHLASKCKAMEGIKPVLDLIGMDLKRGQPTGQPDQRPSLRSAKAPRPTSSNTSMMLAST
jgi:hypothetical protein